MKPQGLKTPKKKEKSQQRILIVYEHNNLKMMIYNTNRKIPCIFDDYYTIIMQ